MNGWEINVFTPNIMLLHHKKSQTIKKKKKLNRVRGGPFGHLLVHCLKFNYKCLINQIFFKIHGVAILSSAFLVLGLGAIVHYNRIKHFLTHVWKGENWLGGIWSLYQSYIKNSNTLYFVMKFTDIMI